MLDTLFGKPYFLYGAHEEDRIKGVPGEILAQRHGAICRGTIDGAVWIIHLGCAGPAGCSTDEAAGMTCSVVVLSQRCMP